MKSVIVLGVCCVAGANCALTSFALIRPVEANDVVQSPPEPKDDPSGNSLPTKLIQDPPGLHNVLRASETVYSGSEPHGEAAFKSLGELGIKTIVSVDGARPDVKTASKYGIRYVHIPIGYDAIPEKAGLSLAAVAQNTKKPVYVHCHHGRHRGPAAAAILCRATAGTDALQAKRILDLAQTGKEYAGLWRDVANYNPPPADAKLPELVEVAQVESFAAAMAQIDRHWDHLKLCRDANWQALKEHPDLSPAQEALLIKEGLREAHRALGKQRDGRFHEWLSEASTTAQHIEADLKAGRRDQLENRMRSLEKSCKTCHASYRN